MRRKEDFYLKQEGQVQAFLKTLENAELFTLKALVHSKAYKSYICECEREKDKRYMKLFEVSPNGT